MGYIWYIVIVRNAVIYLLSHETDSYKDEGNRYLPVFHHWEGSEDDKGKHDAAGSEESGIREEYIIGDTGHKCRYEDYDDNLFWSVSFLKYRSQKEQVWDIAEQMSEVSVPQYMGESSHICQRIGKWRAVSHEDPVFSPALSKVAEAYSHET